MTETLYIDVETYSSYNLTDVGMYKYIESEDFEVMLLAYAFNDKPVQVVDLTKEPLPPQVERALGDIYGKIVAHNAMFEYSCLRKIIPSKEHINHVRAWNCTMARGAYLGLP